MNDQQLFIIISLIVIFLIYDKLTQKSNNANQEEQIYNLQKENKQLIFQVKSIKKSISNANYRADHYDEQIKEFDIEIKRLEEMIYELFERWDILAHKDITTIPVSKDEWEFAKKIYKQQIPKKWIERKLTQTKDALLKANKHINSEPSEQELNQDMTQFSDKDLDNILEDEKEDSSSSSSSSDSNNQMIILTKKNNIKTM